MAVDSSSNCLPENCRRPSTKPYENVARGENLKRSLGFKNLFFFVVGALVGSGIFISPHMVAQETNSMTVALIVWVGSGIACVLGALCFCELANFYGKTGGMYLFIKNVYGDIVGFLTVWTQIFIISPAGIAIMAATIGKQIASFFCDPKTLEEELIVRAVAISCVAVSFICSCNSTNFAAKTQIFFTVVQIIIIFLTLVLGVWNASNGDVELYSQGFKSARPFDFETLNLALYSGLWAYDGWGFICNLVEETQNPERNLWLSSLTGILFVTFCYVAINLSFMTKLSFLEIGKLQSPFAAFISRSLGNEFLFIVPILISFACFGTMNAWLFTSARSLLSASREGQFPKLFSFIHQERRIPILALVKISVLTTVWIIVAGSRVEILLTYFSFAIWLIYGMAIFSVLVLRYERPNAERPYKVFIAFPVIMSIISSYLMLSSFIKMPLQSGICLIILLSSIPCHYIFIKSSHQLPERLKNLTERFYQTISVRFGLVPCILKEEEDSYKILPLGENRTRSD